MNKVNFSHFYAWGIVPDYAILNVMLEFADNGAKNLVFNENIGFKSLDNEDFYKNFLHSLKTAGLNLCGCHGLYSLIYDLNETDPDARQKMIAGHKKIMTYASEAGSRTYTVHIGAKRENATIEQLRQLTIDSLEQLIPTAEKNNMIIAVENATDPTNTADEVLYYLDYFKTETLGCCLDVGHANIMTAGPGKEISKFSPPIQKAWQGLDIKLYDDVTAKLAPHIVVSHLHDNDGFDDRHKLPGYGTVNWEKLMPQLLSCPRLLNLENEASPVMFPASIRKHCETYHDLIRKYGLLP